MLDKEKGLLGYVRQRKRLTKEDSTTLCKAVKSHKGKWDSIMADKDVKKLKIDVKFAQSHVANKKKKIKKVAGRPCQIYIS